MRITVVTTSYPERHGDPSGHFVETEVAELRAQGHLVEVVTPRPGGAFGWPGVAARLRERPWRALEVGGWAVRAALEVRRARPERIVAHWALPSGLPVALGALQGPGGRAVELELVSHGADVRLLRGLPSAARASLVRRLVARAAGWRFVSGALLEDLVAVLPEDVARELRTRAVVEPSPLGRVEDVTEAAHAKRKRLEGRRLYVCAGRLVAGKRVDMVIDYVASARGHGGGSDPVLVVLGDGPEKPRLERLAQRWQMDVRFLGTMPRAEALAWIGAADEVVHASRAEGLSTVVREAEHLGVPVTFLT